MDDISHFMKNELVKYIKQELNKGNSLDSIKMSLLKGGHHTDLVNETIRILRNNNFDLTSALKERIKIQLTGVLYHDILNSVIRYVEFHIEQGRSLAQIEKTLFKYGHTRETVNTAINEVLFGSKKHDGKGGYFLPASIIALSVFIFWIAYSAEESLANVILGLFPLILSFIFTGIILEKADSRYKNMIWIIPFVASGIFYVIGISSGIGLFGGLNVEKLTILNILFSLFSIAILTLIKNMVLTHPTNK